MFSNDYDLAYNYIYIYNFDLIIFKFYLLL